MEAGTREAGFSAESLALEHLARSGLRLLARNWLWRNGELDLVMLDGDTVVFVEVRYRRYAAWGGALESVDSRKQQKLIRTAQRFLQQESRWAKHPCRFDVVAIGLQGKNTTLDWVRNAFDG
ncbi:YraN family protein [Stutzerimonas azotifigens]|uniref:YraN family protein n=1 Tax=Stutzerimonas azotifigens TaxID=291995 RepID=UPI00040890F4|nr:YraN family protein [Stutzerimonas azotifigens]